VAVIVVCHNFGRFLAEAIHSVLVQTRPPAEVLVVDDASNDDTSAVAA
jgi:glycosyltransferase involved in cell wall biosynthesis